MAKRKEPDTPSKARVTSSKRSKKQLHHENDLSPSLQSEDELAGPGDTTESTPVKSGRSKDLQNGSRGSDRTVLNDEPTPKHNGTAVYLTPRKDRNTNASTPSRSAKADRSAKRKSAQALIPTQEEDAVWENSAALAQAILDEAENIIESSEHRDDKETTSVEPSSAPTTPSKRSRGRPKGAKNRRSPTPEGDLPPEERYFFQNRTGPTQISANSFAHLGFLSQDEYFEHIRMTKADHEPEKSYLMKLHARAFPQWRFELEEDFSVCLYGYGSKRKLMNKFAEWLYPRLGGKKRIVILNGYALRVNIRNVLSTIGNALVEKDQEMKLTGQPHDMLDTILSHLTDHVHGKLIIMVNSIDSSALRRSSIQSVLARLAAHPQVNLIASADTPTFPILWNSALRDQFRFVFHDCTTFAPYDIEIHPVDDVNELLGRKNRRAGGKEGIGFVLKSLPENARNLYRVLLTEILTVVNDGYDDPVEDEEGDIDRRRKATGEHAEDVSIEYRSLYQKASEEFICSSDMNFRFLLKEFHDHQMLTSRRDPGGTELLGVPLQRDEMEAVLEELVVG